MYDGVVLRDYYGEWLHVYSTVSRMKHFNLRKELGTAAKDYS